MLIWRETKIRQITLIVVFRSINVLAPNQFPANSRYYTVLYCALSPYFLKLHSRLSGSGLLKRARFFISSFFFIIRTCPVWDTDQWSKNLPWLKEEGWNWKIKCEGRGEEWWNWARFRSGSESGPGSMENVMVPDLDPAKWCGSFRSAILVCWWYNKCWCF